MRLHLFNSTLNSILTIVCLYIIYITVSGAWSWGIADAVWVADNRRECFSISIDGACWAGVFAWMDNIFYGRYPREELWRVNLGGFLLFIWMAPLWLPRVKAKIFIGLTATFLYPFLAGYLFTGGERGIFMQVMVTAAIVCLAGNTMHSIIGVLGGRSLPEFLTPSDWQEYGTGEEPALYSSWHSRPLLYRGFHVANDLGALKLFPGPNGAGCFSPSS